MASGSQAISCAVEAVAKARRFLGDDDEACELYCQPAFRDRGMGSSVALYLSSSRWRKSDVDQTVSILLELFLLAVDFFISSTSLIDLKSVKILIYRKPSLQSARTPRLLLSLVLSLPG